MTAAFDRLNRLLNTSRFVRFAIVGGVGFIVDIALLFFAMSVFSLNAYAGRILSLPCAFMATFYLNRAFTFKQTQPTSIGQIGQYFWVKAFGWVINFTIYALLLKTITPPDHVILAVVVSTGITMFVNFLFLSRFVFREQNG